MKWLADVAALLGDADEVERLYAASQALGAGRAAGQALLLANRYLDAVVPSALLARVRRDRGTRLMAHVAGRMMTAPDGKGQRDANPKDVEAEIQLGILTGFNDEALTNANVRLTLRGKDVRSAAMSGSLP